MTLEGRRFVITGAASGIGLSTAVLFVQNGASVSLFDRNDERLSEAVGEVIRAGGEASVSSFAVDVANSDTVPQVVSQAAEIMGGIDGLVGTAGIDLLKPFSETTAAEWRNVIDVNLTGAFNAASAVVPFMQQAGGGTIVNVSSGAGLRPLEARTAYCTSKAGLVMFTKALAVDVAQSNIRANVICPGVIDTPLFRTSFEGLPDPEGELEKILDRYLIRKIGTPQDIANAALFLSCDQSAHVTGSTLTVDGGRAFH